jgi:sugar lactone lactonase YvrE
MTEHVSVAVSRRTECGEGPVWDATAGLVHWVDIIPGEILATDPATGVTTTRTYPAMVGAVAQRTDGGLVAAVATGFVGFGPDGEIDHRVDCLAEGVRMNDAKTDPAGRYWSGSCAMDFAAGRGGLWRLDDDFEATLVLPNLTQPNGMDWSPSGDTFYLVETQARQILRFGFDVATGSLESNASVLVDADAFPGYPDGLCVDSRGHLWVAEFAGSAVHEFTPAGERVRTVPIPASQTTSCAFVGPDLDELWVTSAGVGIDPDVEPDAGSTFRVTGLGVTGRASTPFRC